MRRLLLTLLVAAAALAGCDHGGTPPGHSGSGTARDASTAATRTSPPTSTAPTSTAPADQPGSAWQIPANANGGIEGFADRAGVLAGQPVRLFVSTTSASFRVRAFRMGWYRGMLGRLVWTSPTYPGHKQSAPALVAPATRTWAARWTPSLTIDTTGWLPGDYLLRLDGSGKHMQYVPLTIRSPSAAGKVVLVSAVTTWQAYNTWGCCDLYAGGDGRFATRSRAVSFDRPYANGNGAGEFLDRQLGVLALAERLRLPLDYVTDVDLNSVPHLLDGARAVISMGHDEYWSPAMRAAITAARDAGTNLAFLGGNAMLRRIRFAATPLGPDRLEINYKAAEEDPLFGKNNAAVTADWPAPPAANPESSVIGAQYGCFPGRVPRAPGVIVSPGNWLFAGTGVTAGERLPGLIGPELDAVQLSYPTPRPIEVLLHSPVQCPGGTPSHADTTYYVARSGAGVFDAGTIDWACVTGGSCHGRAAKRTIAVVQQVTTNLLTAFAKGPAGRRHPARDNLAALGIG